MRQISVAVVAVLAFGCGRAPDFKVRESVEQLHVTHATPGQELEVVDAKGHVVTTGQADVQGSLVFRHLAPGKGYAVRTTGKSAEQTGPLEVMSVEGSTRSPEWYAKQQLTPGFNYLTMRDGTTLSAWVTVPKGRGPFPTVVNYSGYDASRPPAGKSDYDFLCPDFPVLCAPPSDGIALLAGMLGYATVSVNMRGTGCSGGAYDYFERLQLLDGYDIIETVAAQSWVAHHQVGMVGLSYPGISQLFVASTRPPSLAAIAPMSVIGSTTSTLLPGGILNDGFAMGWVDNVLSRAVPYGQGWERAQVDSGDSQCAENQLLHSQMIDNVAEAREVKFYDPAQHDRYSPATFVGDIEVPVFLTGSWQDEQTGPYFFLLFDKFTHAPALRMSATNGVHIDGIAPQLLIEWQAFLELFVAKRVPEDPTKLRNFAALFSNNLFHVPMVLPASRFSSFTSYDDAVAAWKAEPPLRVIFESGAGDPQHLGAPLGTFEHSFAAQWPVPETEPLELYLQPGGKLAATAPAVSSAASAFALDPTAGQRGVLAPGGDVWAPLPAYDWREPAPGEAVVFESEPLAADTVMLGTAGVQLWLESPVDDADLQVTLSEVRIDGKEVYVQSGWLRASYRQPGPGATAMWPAQTLEEQDWSPLPVGEWVQVSVGTAGFAHVMRLGSKIRLTVDTPGGVRADWRFALETFPGPVRYAIGHDSAHPSKVVLPRLRGVAVPSAPPPCPSLRGQPCRDEMEIANQSP